MISRRDMLATTTAAAGAVLLAGCVTADADAPDGQCTYCGHCAPCAEGIDIARVNQLYDLAAGHDEIPSRVLAQYRALKRHAGDCTGCGRCERLCPFHVPVIDRMRDAALLFGE